jgi:hypothetical protein
MIVQNFHLIDTFNKTRELSIDKRQINEVPLLLRKTRRSTKRAGVP